MIPFSLLQGTMPQRIEILARLSHPQTATSHNFERYPSRLTGDAAGAGSLDGYSDSYGIDRLVHSTLNSSAHV